MSTGRVFCQNDDSRSSYCTRQRMKAEKFELFIDVPTLDRKNAKELPREI